MTDNAEWGPLAALIGEWEGEQGLDLSFHNAEGEIGDTPYREKISMKPFGPVDNGAQRLYGLDYRMAAWRGGRGEPVPHRGRLLAVGRRRRRGHALLHGPARARRCWPAARLRPSDTSFSMEATVGAEAYGILSNKYLAEKART